MQTVTLVVPLFALIFLGYGLRKTGFFSPAFASEANRLVYYIALPAMILTEMLEVSAGELLQPQLVIGLPLVVLATAAVGVAVSPLIKRERRGAFAQLCYRANFAYFGLPIVSTALGPASLGYIGVIVAVGIIVNTTLTVLLLKLMAPEPDSSSIAKRLAGVFRNPLIIAVVLGLLASFSDLVIPTILLETLRLIGRTGLPLILLVIGFSLSFSRLGRSLALNSAAAFVKLAVMPLIAYTIATLVFGADGMLRDVLVLMCAMPTAAASQSFAALFGADEQVTAAGVSLSTLASMLTIPLWIAFV